jgi:hypothetical protein
MRKERGPITDDDLSYFVEIVGKRHLVLPYAFNTNHMQFFHTNGFSGAADFALYVIDAFDWLLSRRRARAENDVDRAALADDWAARPYRCPR